MTGYQRARRTLDLDHVGICQWAEQWRCRRRRGPKERQMSVWFQVWCAPYPTSETLFKRSGDPASGQRSAPGAVRHSVTNGGVRRQQSGDAISNKNEWVGDKPRRCDHDVPDISTASLTPVVWAVHRQRNTSSDESRSRQGSAAGNRKRCSCAFGEAQ